MWTWTFTGLEEMLRLGVGEVDHNVMVGVIVLRRTGAELDCGDAKAELVLILCFRLLWCHLAAFDVAHFSQATVVMMRIRRRRWRRREGSGEEAKGEEERKEEETKEE